MFWNTQPLCWTVIKDWHRWFAWYPVEVWFNQSFGTVWFQWVERRIDQRVFYSWDSDPRNVRDSSYRLIEV